MSGLGFKRQILRGFDNSSIQMVIFVSLHVKKSYWYEKFGLDFAFQNSTLAWLKKIGPKRYVIVLAPSSVPFHVYHNKGMLKECSEYIQEC